MSNYHHGDLREALLDQASMTLARHGADAISLRALARALDVSHAAPGHHFSSRSELLGELAADGYRDLSDSMASAMESSSVDRWLTSVGRAYVDFGLSNPEQYRLMFASQLMSSEDCPERLVTESTRAYLILLTAAHKREPDLTKAAEYRVQVEELAAWSMVHGAVMLRLDGQMGSVVSDEEYVELVDGLLAAHFG